MSAFSDSLGRPVARRRRRIRREEWIAGAILSVIVAVSLFPFVFMLITSLKTNLQFATSYWAPAWPLHFDNYATAWRQIHPYFVTTAIVAGCAVLGTALLASSAAFVFARYDFLGRKVLFGLLAALLMVPSLASLIPLFVMMRDFQLLNTTTVLVLPQLAAGIVFGTILIKTFVDGLPAELFDAARVDGAGGVRMFRHIMLPLCRPAVGTISLIILINVWNEFFWPLLTISDDKLRTIPVGLSYFHGQNVTEWGPLFAGYTLASLPLLLAFTFLSKYFLAGIQGGLPTGGGQ